MLVVEKTKIRTIPREEVLAVLSCLVMLCCVIIKYLLQIIVFPAPRCHGSVTRGDLGADPLRMWRHNAPPPPPCWSAWSRRCPAWAAGSAAARSTTSTPGRSAPDMQAMCDIVWRGCTIFGEDIVKHHQTSLSGQHYYPTQHTAAAATTIQTFEKLLNWIL